MKPLPDKASQGIFTVTRKFYGVKRKVPRKRKKMSFIADIEAMNKPEQPSKYPEVNASA